jgi:outer membrane protein OmpA-like peptidoglycan-associated protein
MLSRSIKFLSQAFAVAIVALVPAVSSAQASGSSTQGHSPSKWDIFAGYSYLAPKGNVTTPTPTGGSLTAGYKAINVGGLFSGAYFFNKYVGVQGEYGLHEWGTEVKGSPVGTHGNNDGFQSVAGGLIGRFPMENITPFVHGLVGGALVNGPAYQPNKWGPQLTVGGGMDYELPFFNHRLAYRLFQADFQYTHANFGPGPTPPGGRANINAARLSTGLVMHMGSIIPPPPVTLACSASPTSVFPGEPVTVTASAGNLDPKLNAIYAWSGSGASGSGTSTTIQTASLAPGSYTVNGDLKEGKAGKEGLKPGQSADCSSSFTVKAFEPPTISCSVDPTTIKPGDTATVTSRGMSPQNRPLTYSYSATSGTVSGSGTTGAYASAGAPVGPVNFTCNVADDKGHTATANTSLTIVAPPPPPVENPEIKQIEARLALHSVFFPTDLPKTANPTGGLVSSQETTLTTLATDFKRYLEFKPDAHLTLIGHADKRGSAEYNKALSERRVARTKQFLVEQGIAESAIQTQALGSDENLSSDQVKALIQQNSELSAADQQKMIRKLPVIVLAQNRRVDITLSTTGQQSVQTYPFNAADSLTLLDTKSPAGKTATQKKK